LAIPSVDFSAGNINHSFLGETGSDNVIDQIAKTSFVIWIKSEMKITTIQIFINHSHDISTPIAVPGFIHVIPVSAL